MPNMGLGKIGEPDIIFKRKNRWTFSIFTENGLTINENFVKISSKPKTSIDPVEVPYKNATLKIPGKAKFSPITVTYYDVANKDAVALYTWINQLNNQISINAQGRNTINKWKQNEMTGWYSDGFLRLYDGCGQVLEDWTFHYLYPSDVDFGEMDYSSGDVSEITITCEYSEISYSPNPECIGTVNFDCQGCNIRQSIF